MTAAPADNRSRVSMAQKQDIYTPTLPLNARRAARRKERRRIVIMRRRGGEVVLGSLQRRSRKVLDALNFSWGVYIGFI